jgi:phage repressor protein C with HTH and peptisase S24 domain
LRDAVGQYPHMEKPDDFLAGLKKVMEAKGIKPAPLSEKAGLGVTAVRDLYRGKAASPKLSTALKIAHALDMTLDQLLTAAHTEFSPAPTISIAGKVGAGARVPVFDVYEKGDGPQVECPAGLSSSGIVAVEAEGDSMEPAFSAGDILFYTRHSDNGVPEEAVGAKCVCEDENGMGWVKQIKRGTERGLFNLISLNPTAENQHDIKLIWAARVRLHWPAELVKKI